MESSTERESLALRRRLVGVTTASFSGQPNERVMEYSRGGNTVEE
jgi:hypothetical protein